MKKILIIITTIAPLIAMQDSTIQQMKVPNDTSELLEQPLKTHVLFGEYNAEVTSVNNEGNTPMHLASNE